MRVKSLFYFHNFLKLENIFKKNVTKHVHVDVEEKKNSFFLFFSPFFTILHYQQYIKINNNIFFPCEKIKKS